MAEEVLSQEDQDFLAEAEEELKDRYTEKDEEFMKVFNLPPSDPPVIENWYASSGRRNNYRRHTPYDRPNNRYGGQYGRDRDRDYRDRGHGSYRDDRRGYNDYEDNRRSGYDRRRY